MGDKFRIEIVRVTMHLPNGDRDRERHKCFAYSIELVSTEDNKSRCALQSYSQEDRFYTSIRDGEKVRKEAINYAATVSSILKCEVSMVDMKMEESTVETIKTTSLDFTPEELANFVGS